MSTAGAGLPGAPHQGARILVADDSDVVRKVVSKMLTSKGFVVTQCSSGEEAFAKVIETRFDLVVTDVVMGALSGIQLCRLIRSDPDIGGTPVVLLTAAYDPRSRFWGAHSGADACIAKEAMNAELLTTIYRLLDSHTQPSRIDPSGGLSTEPLARLSQVLDQLLFQAVVAAEARKLLPPGGNRHDFSDGIIKLASQITDYAYLVVKLEGANGPSWHVHARAPWPRETTPEALAAVGIADTPVDRVTIRSSGSIPAPGGQVEIRAGERSTFTIGKGLDPVGQLVAFGGHKRLAMADQATLSLLVTELEFVVRSLLLIEQTQRMAHTDGLTNLHNRHRTNEYLVHEVERSRRYGSPLTVMLVDVDHFKAVNDICGHATGDAVLQSVAGVLKRGARTTDIVGRWGGEEFLVILPGTEMQGASIAAERQRASLETEPLPPGVPPVTLSAGLAQFGGKESPEALISRADAALYRAKANGRNRVERDE